MQNTKTVLHGSQTHDEQSRPTQPMMLNDTWYES